MLLLFLISIRKNKKEVVSGYVVLIKRIFGVQCICINCLKKVRKQLQTKLAVSEIEICSERSRCFQCFKKQRMM